LGNTFVPILQLGSKEVLPFESVQCSKRIANGPMNMALSKKKKKSFEHTHELINMKHTMSKSDNFGPIFLQKQPLCDLEPHFLGHPSGPTIFPQKSTCVLP
jgi:hypothetical protein